MIDGHEALDCIKGRSPPLDNTGLFATPIDCELSSCHPPDCIPDSQQPRDMVGVPEKLDYVHMHLLSTP